MSSIHKFILWLLLSTVNVGEANKDVAFGISIQFKPFHTIAQVYSEKFNNVYLEGGLTIWELFNSKCFIMNRYSPCWTLQPTGAIFISRKSSS